MPNCALCGGDNEEMGLLGNHLWFRCRACGLEDYLYTPPQCRCFGKGHERGTDGCVYVLRKGETDNE